MSNTQVKPGLYEHFKGGKAIVFSVGKHTEAHHLQFVHYFDVLEDGSVDGPWYRPFDMFTQRIVRNVAPAGAVPNMYDGPRFWRVGTLDEGLKLIGVESILDLLPGANDPVEEPTEEAAPEPPQKRIHDASVPFGGYTASK